MGAAWATLRTNSTSSTAIGRLRRTRRRVRRSEIELVPVVVVELEERVLHCESLGELHEAAPVRAAAELAVVDHLQPDVLLHRDHVPDRSVLDRPELGLGHLRESTSRKAWRSRCGPQQTADVIGAKRRPAVCERALMHDLCVRGVGSRLGGQAG